MIPRSAATLELTRQQLDRGGNYSYKLQQITLSVICQSDGQPSDFSVTAKNNYINDGKFSVNVTPDRDILSAQIQSNAAKLIGRRFIVQVEMTQNILQKQPRSFEGQNGIFCNGQVNLLISNRLSMHFTCWRLN